MDGNVYTSNTVAQREFYKWVMKWLCGPQFVKNLSDPNLYRSSITDVPTLACFLQAIGFKLRSFEKTKQTSTENETNENKSSLGLVKVQLECGISGMKAVLEAEPGQCRCPNVEDMNASFWSISGTGPSADNLHKVEETGSNLLPRISKDARKVIRDVSCHLFEMIDQEPDLNLNVKSKTPREISRSILGIARSYTHPDMRCNEMIDINTLPQMPVSHSLQMMDLSDREKSTSSDASTRVNASPSTFKKPLVRRDTFTANVIMKMSDEEPRPSPPKITSSPAIVEPLCSSFSHVSLYNDYHYEPDTVANYIQGAQCNLEKALRIVLRKPPFECKISSDQSSMPPILPTSTKNTSTTQDSKGHSIRIRPSPMKPSKTITPHSTKTPRTATNFPKSDRNEDQSGKIHRRNISNWSSISTSNSSLLSASKNVNKNRQNQTIVLAAGGTSKSESNRVYLAAKRRMSLDKPKGLASFATKNEKTPLKLPTSKSPSCKNFASPQLSKIPSSAGSAKTPKVPVTKK